jgi:pimeloyl-ACP methyl ester carboxylesterase
MKKKFLSILLITIGLLLVSCSQPTASPTQTHPPEEPDATVETAIPNPTQEPSAIFEGGPCPFSVAAGQKVECGHVVVPEDHNIPDGPTIRLAVVVFKDQTDEHLPDPVIFLAGGPGEKIVANAPAVAQAFASVYPNRDLIIFDQRGVGLSEPALECPEVVEASFDLLDEPDQSVAMQVVFEAVMDCRDRLVNEGHNLSAYNTAQNAADVNAIRAALGYEVLNLLGGSYGSLLAQAVMRDHPKMIRSVVMESVLPLEKSIFVDSTATVPEAILRLIESCNADESCDSAYPDLLDVLFEVIDRLNEEPVSITITDPLDGQRYDALLSGDMVLGNLNVVLYLTPTIPVVPQAIYDVYNRDYDLMTRLTGLRFIFSDATSRGMMYSVICTEDLVGRTQDEIIDIQNTLPEQFAGSVDPGTQSEYSIFAMCENWPVEQAETWVKEPLVSDIPTLLLAGELDPVTPPEYAELVAGYLSSSTYYMIPGAGHTGDINDCAQDIISSFFDDPSKVPGASCLASMPGLVFEVPGESAEVTMKPYSNGELGLSCVVPDGWDEIEPGIFSRPGSVLNAAAMQVAVVPLSIEEVLDALTQNYALDEIPESTGERQANDLVWSLYDVEAQDAPRDIALAESDGMTLVVIVRSPADEQDALFEAVFLPIVDAMVTLE